MFKHYDNEDLKVVDESVFFLVCKLIDKKLDKKKIKIISKKYEKTNKKIDYVKFC